MKLFLIGFIIWIIFSASESSENGVCGDRPLVEDVRGSPVVGGKDSEPGGWPWTVSIQENTAIGYFHLCGGVLLNHLWVLTAAHCFKNRSNEYFSWRLVFGENELTKMGKNAHIRTIKEMIQHKNYDPETESNDIALLKLNKPIVFDEYTQPACLPPKKAILSKMDDCFIAGWGIREEMTIESSDMLQEAPVNLIPVESCNSPTWYNGSLGDYNLCAGNEQGGINTCEGDSGGPLMCKRHKTKFYMVVGVTSRGSGCAQKKNPGVYTSTQFYLEWILEHISDEIKPASKSRKMKKMKAIKKIWPKLAKKLAKARKKNH